MKKIDTNNRRNFLKTAGAAIVAASVPATLLAQSDQPHRSQNNLKQMIVFGGIAEPNPLLGGIFGLACYQFHMTADIAGTRGGFGTISDPVFTELNSHIAFQSGRRDINDIYIFQGSVRRSLSPDLIGKAATVKVQVLPDGNCNVSLAIENTPLAMGLLLPAVQKIRVPIYS